MRLKLNYLRQTMKFVYYETEGGTEAFGHGDAVMKLWIPKHEIVTNVPGVYPESIYVDIQGGS